MAKEANELELEAFRERMGWGFEWVTDSLGLICCATMAYYGVRAALASYTSGSMSIKTLVTPEWWLLSALPLAFAVLALGRYLRHTQSAVPYTTAALSLDGVELAQAAGGQPLLWDVGGYDHPLPGDGSRLQVRISGPANAKAHITWLESGVPLTPPPAADHAMNVRRRFLDERGIILVDFKLEFGRHHGEILLGDEICPDTCRFWDKASRKKLDKDRFRRDLGDVEEAYQEMLRRVED